MHPDPVPTSTMRTKTAGEGARPTPPCEHGLDHVLGFRTRNEHGRSNDQIHAPEFLMSGDVLGGHAAFAFGQGLVVAALFVRGEFALGMGVEIGAVAFQGEHEQQFGIHARRGDVGRAKRDPLRN